MPWERPNHPRPAPRPACLSASTCSRRPSRRAPVCVSRSRNTSTSARISRPSKAAARSAARKRLPGVSTRRISHSRRARLSPSPWPAAVFRTAAWKGDKTVSAPSLASGRGGEAALSMGPSIRAGRSLWATSAARVSSLTMNDSWLSPSAAATASRISAASGSAASFCATAWRRASRSRYCASASRKPLSHFSASRRHSRRVARSSGRSPSVPIRDRPKVRTVPGSRGPAWVWRRNSSRKAPPLGLASRKRYSASLSVAASASAAPSCSPR